MFNNIYFDNDYMGGGVDLNDANDNEYAIESFISFCDELYIEEDNFDIAEEGFGKFMGGSILTGLKNALSHIKDMFRKLIIRFNTRGLHFITVPSEAKETADDIIIFCKKLFLRVSEAEKKNITLGFLNFDKTLKRFDSFFSKSIEDYRSSQIVEIDAKRYRTELIDASNTIGFAERWLNGLEHLSKNIDYVYKKGENVDENRDEVNNKIKIVKQYIKIANLIIRAFNKLLSLRVKNGKSEQSEDKAEESFMDFMIN